MAVSPVTPALSEPRRHRGVLLAGAGLVAALVVVGLVLIPGSDVPTPIAAKPSASATPDPTVPEIYQFVGPSVVVISTAKGSLGTGIIASDTGGILTANHVISDGSAITVAYADGTKSRAAVEGADASIDIAMLTPEKLPETLVPATFGGAVEVGGDVVAIGNPLGLTFSVSSGVISGLNRTAKTDSGRFTGLIQFDASVNPGSSGGPLLDGKGGVIGIVISIADPGDDEAFAGIAFAVPIGAALGGVGGDGPGNDGPQI